MWPSTLKVIFLFAFKVIFLFAIIVAELEIIPKREHSIMKHIRIFKNGLNFSRLSESPDIRDNEQQVGDRECKCLNGKCIINAKGKAVCQCPPEFGLYSPSKCKECNCGKDSNCTFNIGFIIDTKTCICEKGYKEVEGICKETSISSSPASSTTMGILIKTTPHATSTKTMLLNASTTPSTTSTKTTLSEVSRRTNLFTLSRTSPFRNSVKTTPLIQGTSPYSIENNITSTTAAIPTTKTSCECRYGCTTNEKDEIVCKCLPGYGLYTKYLCKECRCGENVECSFDKYGHKKCHCPHGFVEFQDKCKECYCGLNSACSFDYFGAKKCLCPDGFAELSGICTKCYCGQNSACFFDKYGSKKCECEDGFIEMNGKCKDVCDVYPCIHGTCIKTPGKGAACECNKNYKGIFCDVEKEKIIEVKRESVISVAFLGVMLSVFLLQFLIFAYLQCRRQ